jgi:hypothetical protein
MPRVSEFYGIIIAMYYNDHLPPHFHARYGGARASIGIDTLEVLSGALPPRALTLVREWATQNRGALLRDWGLAMAAQPLDPIPPLS